MFGLEKRNDFADGNFHFHHVLFRILREKTIRRILPKLSERHFHCTLGELRLNKCEWQPEDSIFLGMARRCSNHFRVQFGPKFSQ